MPGRILYIINPIAGARTKKGLQELIEKATKAKNIPYSIYPSVASGDYSFLEPIIKQEKITDIIIAGGDGTVSQVVGSLLSQDVNFGIIPCGSGNGLAFTARIPKKAEQALDMIFTGKPNPIDGFFINNRFACMLCGLGFDAKVAHEFAKQPERGLSTYIKQVIKNFFSAATYTFEIQLEKGSIVTDAYFISIANSNQFGNNFTIAPKASLTDGLLDIVIVTSQNKLSVLFQTFRQLLGRNKLQPETMVTGKKGVIYFQTKKLTIINKNNAPLHIDGDPAETADKIEIEIAKKTFKLIF